MFKKVAFVSSVVAVAAMSIAAIGQERPRDVKRQRHQVVNKLQRALPGQASAALQDSTLNSGSKDIEVPGTAKGDSLTTVIISEIVDGPLPGGHPKTIEITNVGCEDVDLSTVSYGIYSNGGTTLNSGTSYLLDSILAAGDSYVVSFEAAPVPCATECTVDDDCLNGPCDGGVCDDCGFLACGTHVEGMCDTEFEDIYGFPADFYGGAFPAPSINGDDVAALFDGIATGDGSDATTIDVYGVIGTNGDGECWDYTDCYSESLATRTTPNGGAFDCINWDNFGANCLEGADDVEELANVLAETSPGEHTFDAPNCAPAGDDCTTAETINCGDSIIGLTTVGYTNTIDLGGGNPCTNFTTSGADRVFQLNVAEPTNVSASMFNAEVGFDASFYVITDCDNPLDDCTGDDSGQPKVLDFVAQPGVDYFLVTDGWGAGDEGTYDLSVTCEAVPGAGGEDCSEPTPIGCDDVVAVDTTAFADDYDIADGCGLFGSLGPDRVFVLNVAAPTSISALMNQSDYDGVFYVVTDCDDLTGTCIGGADVAPGGDKTADFVAEPGVDYFLVVDGWDAPDAGTSTLSVTCSAAPGETCDDPEPIACGDTVAVDTSFNVNDYELAAANACTGYNSAGPDKVFVLNVAAPTNVSALMNNQSYDGSFYVVTDCDDLLSDCTGADCFPPPCDKPVDFVAQPGVDYYIIADGFGGASGTSDVSIACTPAGGACCTGIACEFVENLGACIDLGGQFQGLGTICENVVCGGACCDADDGCTQEASQGDCDAAGGIAYNAGESCDDFVCFQCPLSECDTLTQNASDENEGAVRCASDFGSTPGGYARCMDLNAEVGSSSVVINSVSFGVSEATVDGINVNINIYEEAGCPPTLGTATLLHTEAAVINIADEGGTVTVAIPDIAVSNFAVIEIFQVDNGSVDPGGFFFSPAQNDNGECGDTYIRADNCGLVDFTPYAGIGFPGQALVLDVGIICCGDGVVEGDEECDGGDCCTDTCTFDSGTTCRASAGACDVAEVCSGDSADCPADELAPAGTECDPGSGPGCLFPSECDGTSVDCPANEPITMCADGDGCCPSTCNANSDSDCAAVCGNGRLEAGECCDDGNLEDGDGCDSTCECEAPPVPTVTTWGMICLTLALLVGIAVATGRRRQIA